VRARSPTRRRSTGALASVVLASALVLGAGALAHAELSAKGDLLLSFQGGISPRSLPRAAPAPVTVNLLAKVATPAAERPPALKEISIALSRGGHLDIAGLALCPFSRLRGTSAKAALAVCGDALVGRGSFIARLGFSGPTTFPSRGRILAFNSTSGGHPALLVHLFGLDPLSVNLIVFHIRSVRGTYGTLLTGTLPPALIRSGYLQLLRLRLHRRFYYQGRLHSYLSAACAAPPGVSTASFPFARARMTFSNSRTLTSTLTRSCTVSR
jgi:hypothetical protein